MDDDQAGEGKMGEGKTAEGKQAALPGNHGQFGAGDASEAFKPLEDHPAPGDQGPKQANAGERS